MLFNPALQQTTGGQPAVAPLPPDLLDTAGNSGRITGILKTLAHPARLVILRRLAAGASNSTELMALLQMSRSSLSKQLGRLRDGGLVDFDRDNPDGRAVTIRLHDDQIANLIERLFGDIVF